MRCVTEERSDNFHLVVADTYISEPDETSPDWRDLFELQQSAVRTVTIDVTGTSGRYVAIVVYQPNGFLNFCELMICKW